MKTTQRLRLPGRRLIAAGVLTALAPQVMAYPVEVMTSVPVQTVIQPALATIQTTLGEILSAETETGTAVVQSGEKTTSAITEAARTQREADNFNRQVDRLEKARASYSVPDSICSESASGTAAQVSQATRATASKLTDLQTMDGDNLTREIARQLAASNWLALGIKNELRQANIISGQQLALAAKAEYAPQLQALSSQMSAGVSAQ